MDMKKPDGHINVKAKWKLASDPVMEMDIILACNVIYQKYTLFLFNPSEF